MVIDIKNDIERGTFEQKCFSLYQLDWMQSSGFSVDNICDALMNSLTDQVAEGCVIDTADKAKNAMQCAIEEFYNEQGFGKGSMWACIDEFLDAEYKDVAYMKRLLGSQPNGKALLKAYSKYTNRITDCVPDIEVNTSAGVIKAYGCTNPDQPGIVVMLQPAGCEDEIDLSYISVYENSEYALNGERPVDVAIMSYGSPYTEDYTTKEVVKREDVVKAVMEPVYTRNVASELIESFEDYLEGCGAVVPSPDDDQREDGNDAILFGEVYSNLLDDVENIIITYLEDKISNDAARTMIYDKYNEVLGISTCPSKIQQDPRFYEGRDKIFNMLSEAKVKTDRDIGMIYHEFK